MKGAFIEKARWMVNATNIDVGHSISFSMNTEDKNLLTYIQNQAKRECSIDKADDGHVSVVVNFTVQQVSHMVDENNFETMYTVAPASRFVEDVVLYMLAPEQCNPKFAGAIRG